MTETEEEYLPFGIFNRFKKGNAKAELYSRIIKPSDGWDSLLDSEKPLVEDFVNSFFERMPYGIYDAEPCKRLTSRFTYLERCIFKGRFEGDNNTTITYEKMAIINDRSRERMRQVVNKCLRKIREEIKSGVTTP